MTTILALTLVLVAVVALFKAVGCAIKLLLPLAGLFVVAAIAHVLTAAPAH